MKKWIKRALACAYSAVLLFSVGCKDNDGDSSNSGQGASTTTTVLAENGSTEYVAVIPAAATEAEKTAVNILVEEFAEATGATLPIVSDAGRTFNANDKVISVGRTTVMQGSGLSVTVDELTYEGYKLKQYGNTVVMCGAEDAGTIYSVSDFLREHFAYEVYAIDEVYIEKANKTYLKEIDIVEIPDFWGRMMDGYFGTSAKLASAMRLRSKISSEGYGYGSSRDWLPTPYHTFLQFIPKAKYQAEHPEWFNTVHSIGTQLCLTNTEMIAEFKKNLRQMILDNPHAKIINISEEDYGNSLGQCCDVCKAELKSYGMSGYLIRFINMIIEDTDAWLASEGIERDFYYTTYAYTSGTIVPPVTENKDGTYTVKDESCIPNEKLYMRLTPLDPVCYAHAFTDENCPESYKVYKWIKGWQSITDRFFVWDYDCSYRNYFAFYNLYNSLQANLQLYKEIGVQNIERESTTGSTVRPFAALNGYLTAKLMWDVNEDMPQMMDDFFANYYKSGATYVRQCFDLLRSHCELLDAQREKGFHFKCYDTISAADWPINVLEGALRLLDKALETYEGLKTTEPNEYEKLYKRVLQEQYCIRWMILQNYESYYNIQSKTFIEMLDAFEADTAYLGATIYKESYGTYEWIKELRAKVA